MIFATVVICDVLPTVISGNTYRTTLWSQCDSILSTLTEYFQHCSQCFKALIFSFLALNQRMVC